ncbi:hypothetical protein [Thiobacillus denitrificans]|uniref:hypothetical protein n=1 Tax=Thiobacillus denitrificans TaxID=36861 RepID=UPI0011D16E4F|nr:hypothetical protein [Thiobacillus denitrificans]
MQAKSITIRVSSPEFQTLAVQADEQKTTVTALCTGMVRTALQAKIEDDRLAALENRVLAVLAEIKKKVEALEVAE